MCSRLGSALGFSAESGLLLAPSVHRHHMEWTDICCREGAFTAIQAAPLQSEKVSLASCRVSHVLSH